MFQNDSFFCMCHTEKFQNYFNARVSSKGKRKMLIMKSFWRLKTKNHFLTFLSCLLRILFYCFFSKARKNMCKTGDKITGFDSLSLSLSHKSTLRQLHTSKTMVKKSYKCMEIRCPSGESCTNRLDLCFSIFCSTPTIRDSVGNQMLENQPFNRSVSHNNFLRCIIFEF